MSYQLLAILAAVYISSFVTDQYLVKTTQVFMAKKTRYLWQTYSLR